MSTAPTLTSQQVEQISRALGNTNNGLTGTEIKDTLATLGISDVDASNTKWKRLCNAFVSRINSSGKTNVAYSFILHCFNPASGLNDAIRYRWMMDEVNRALMLSGIEVRDDGKLHKVQPAKSLSEVERRTNSLRRALVAADAHPYVLKCCREELLADDYFHAVQEAAKGLCDHAKTLSGLNLDGTKLFETALSTKTPYIKLTDLKTESGRNQQNGLKEMLDGVMHLVRNPTAHELRIRWDVKEKDAIEILSLISYLHKLLDSCDVVQRPS